MNHSQPRRALVEAVAVELDTSATLLLVMEDLEELILEVAVAVVEMGWREEMAPPV